MINSKLIKSSPEGMRHVYKNVVVMWISLIFQISATFSIGFLIEKLYNQTLELSDALLTASLIFLSIVVRHFSNVKASKYSYLASAHIKTWLRQSFYKKLLDFGLKFQNKMSRAQITQMGSEGIEQIEVYFSLYLPQFFYSLLAPLTLFAVLAFVSLKVSSILLVCVPLIPLSIIMANKIAKRLLSKYWTAYTNLGDNFLDNLKGLVTLKVYQDDAYKNEEMNKDAEHFRKITMKVLTMQLNSVTLMDLIAYGGAALGVLFALMEFHAGKINLGETVVFILLSGEFFIPLRLLGSYFHVAMNGVAAAKKIFKFIETPSEKERKGTLNTRVSEIVFKELDFSYNEDKKILHDVNFKIPNNGFVAFAGESGSGKSTIASLMMGFQPYEKGSILVNGLELNTLNERELMKSFSLIKSKSYFFKGSIRENLLMGNASASDEDMMRVLERVALKGFVEENGGLDYQLQEGGENLSGGQAQRLSLARAILCDAELYIFDEASSNIDVESEQIVFKTLHELRKTKIIILISHRLANLLDCDCIYVLEKGRIVEEGSHQKLLDQQGLYSRLYKKQQILEKAA